MFFFLFFVGEPLTLSQGNRIMLLDEEWDSYSQTYNRYVNGWNFCKNGINDESIVSRANLHAYLSTGYSEGSGTTIATPWLAEVADTFSFYIYGSNLQGHTAQVEFGFIPDTATITDPSDICALFIPYDTVTLSVSNQWQRTTRDMHPYYAIHGTTHRFAIRLINSYHQELYLDEIRAWIPAEKTASSCPTSFGRDFWVMFLANGGDQTPHQTFLTAVGDSNATITVTNPSTGWSTTASLNANQSVQIVVPLTSSISDQSNNAQTKSLGLHVTSTASISLMAKNNKKKCNDLTQVYPSHSLGTRYIMQDYMGSGSHPSVSGAEVGFVATLDNTVLTMVLPCNLINNSAYAGDTLTISLMQGESYQLIASAPGSFSGMEVISNGKTFAAFQGNRVAYIPTGASGADLIYEQAIPVDYWGTDYVVVLSYGRTAEQVRITSAENDCQVYDNGTFIQTLQKGETCEVALSGGAHRYTSSKKVCVGRYLRSSSSGGNPGDPASVMIPPVDQGLQHSRFNVSSAIDISNHYINIVARTSDVGGVTFDGVSISSQFIQLDNTYSFAQIAVSEATHLLESSLGPVVADYYGLGDYSGYAALIGRSFCEQESAMEAACPDKTTKGRDFWVTFFYNYHETESYNPGQHIITAIGDQTCSVDIYNNTTGNYHSTLTSANKFLENRVVGNNAGMPIATVYNGGYHISSSEDIWLYASNYVKCTQDAATIIPTSALDTTYIIQDYPAWQYGAQVAFVATEDSTILTMTVPCDIQGTTISAGTTLTPMLMQGQSYMLISNGDGSSFSGMRVTSNGKPFATFQGGRRVKVPSSGSGSDLLYEQALPMNLWGRDFIVAGIKGQTCENHVRITSSQDNCIVTVDGVTVATLNTGQTVEITYPQNVAKRIQSSAPVCVILYLSSYINGGNSGDPSSVIIPPLTGGLCESRFKTCYTQDISSNNHFVTVICDTAWDNALLFDGTPLPTTGVITHEGHRIHQLTAPYSVSNQGLHHLENSEGPFVAYAYGRGNYESYAFPLGFRIDTLPEEQQACQRGNGQGRDFWATFLCNDDDPANSALSLIATGAQQASVTVTNPVTGWTHTSTLSAGGKVQINLPTANTIPSGQPHNIGYHITSTAPITLYACNYKEGSWDFAQVFPTYAIDDNYIVQNYPNNSDHPANVAFVATENGTNLSMVLPCTVTGLGLSAGDQYTVTLDSGQSLMLRANPGGDFSGMEVSSNCKPFALFQGCAAGRVGDNGTNSGRDHFFEQALSPEMWGTEFVVDASLDRTEGDRVVVTAGADNCIVQINGTTVATLMRGQSQETTLVTAPAAYITTSQPAYACLYLASYRNGGTNGDPGAATLPPVNRWVCHSDFMLHQCNNNPSSQYYIANPYINIIAENSVVGTLALDGTVIPASQFFPISGTSFSHTRMHIDYGAHTLDGGEAGTFSARAYGLGQWVGFTYNIDMLVDTMERCLPQLHHDTITYYDSVCSGQSYISPMEIVCGGTSYFPPSGLIYIPSSGTAEAGILERWSNWVVDDTVHHLHLVLTVLPTYITTLQLSLIPGDTLFFLGDTLTEACNRTYPLQSVYGCDSLVDLYVNYADVTLSSNSQGGCPGEEVTLTAEGTHIFNWSSSPYDPELDSQQGQNPVTVHPQVTTTYHLLDASGLTIASVTVGVEPPPALCVETNRDFIDFDHPVLTLHDCSPDRYSSSWIFSDGYTLSGERARRQFQYPLPDTVTVTLHSCNQYNCCVDTTLGFRPEIRSVWFPNIFTPDLPQNNRFGAVTSCQVADFEIFVYNRQGLLVWHSTDILTPWDGTHDGTPVPQGAYAYRWYLKDLHGDRWSGTGTVTLLR